MPPRPPRRRWRRIEHPWIMVDEDIIVFNRHPGIVPDFDRSAPIGLNGLGRGIAQGHPRRIGAVANRDGAGLYAPLGLLVEPGEGLDVVVYAPGTQLRLGHTSRGEHGQRDNGNL